MDNYSLNHIPDVTYQVSIEIGSVDLFVLEFNVPVNNFSVMSGQSHRFLSSNQYSGELLCLV